MSASPGLTLSDLLVVEDDACIVEFACPETGVLLWPLIRTVFLRTILSDLFYASPLVEMRTTRTGGRWRQAATTLAKSFAHNARAKREGRYRAKICIFTDALGTSLTEGMWFNRLSDHFALAQPTQTLVVEDQCNWVWPVPRHFANVLFHAPWRARAVVTELVSVRSSHRRRASELIDLVGSRAKAELCWDIGARRHGQMTEMLALKLAGLPCKVRRYRAMLYEIEPRVLLLAEGCYGTAGALLTAARELDIPTAEFQHGAVSSGHDAYNLAPSLRSSPKYRHALPDYFLGFGRWWNDQINTPVKKWVVGNPHRDAQLARLSKSVEERNDVLLLGDGIETAKYLQFANELARELCGRERRPALQVVFRPHPLERAVAAASAHELRNGVRIDQSQDIYQSLAMAHAVVSEQSSGLFEAIGLADKVFVWNTSKAKFGFPVHPFQKVESSSDLADGLLDPALGAVASGDADSIWAPDWRVNYAAFLRSCGAV